MNIARRPAVLAVWALLVALLGGLAAARHDDDHVTTTAQKTTTTTTVPGADGGTAPGATDSTLPGAGDGTTGTGGAGTNPGDPGVTGPDQGNGTTPAARTMPLPGTYTMTTTGTSSVGTVPPQSKMIIEQLTDTDQRITTPSGSGDFVAQLRYGPSAVELVSLSFGPKAFQPDPPTLFAPRPLAPGSQWAWSATSTDGKTNLAAQSQTTGTESINVNGTSVDTVIVDTVLTLSGDVTGTAHLTLWVRPDDMLPIRQHSVVDASFGVLIRLQSDTTSQLVDLTPT